MVKWLWLSDFRIHAYIIGVIVTMMKPYMIIALASVTTHSRNSELFMLSMEANADNTAVKITVIATT